MPRLAGNGAGRDARVLVALWEVRQAMQSLAAAAWREIEMVPVSGEHPDADLVTVEVELATRRMHGSLTGLMAALAACPPLMAPRHPRASARSMPRLGMAKEPKVGMQVCSHNARLAQRPRDGPPARQA